MAVPAPALVQYIVVRGDLLKPPLSWPTGAVIAQACHAATAVMHLFKDDPNTQNYLKELDSMHKIVVKAEDLPSLEKLAETLRKNSVDFKMWVEQPEDIPTCIAVKPYPKTDVRNYFKKFKLFA